MEPTEEEDSGLRHAGITGKVLEAAFDVLNELGSGFVESVYEGAMLVALAEREMHVQSQAPVSVYFRGREVGQFVADLLVEDVVLVELKAVKALAPEHQAQVINYLKATGLEVALLLNFGKPKLEYKRLHG